MEIINAKCCAHVYQGEINIQKCLIKDNDIVIIFIDFILPDLLSDSMFMFTNPSYVQMTFATLLKYKQSIKNDTCFIVYPCDINDNLLLLSIKHYVNLCLIDAKISQYTIGKMVKQNSISILQCIMFESSNIDFANESIKCNTFQMLPYVC